MRNYDILVVNYNRRTPSSKAILPQYCRNIRIDIKMSSEYSDITAILPQYRIVTWDIACLVVGGKLYF